MPSTQNFFVCLILIILNLLLYVILYEDTLIKELWIKTSIKPKKNRKYSYKNPKNLGKSKGQYFCIKSLKRLPPIEISILKQKSEYNKLTVSLAKIFVNLLNLLIFCHAIIRV